MSGSLLLRDYPCDLVRLSCEKCGCASQFRKQNLIARYGADIPLPHLLVELVGCHKRGNDACTLILPLAFKRVHVGHREHKPWPQDLITRFIAEASPHFACPLLAISGCKADMTFC